MTARVEGFLTEHALASGLSEQYATVHGGRRIEITLRRDRDRPLAGPIYEVTQVVTDITNPTATPTRRDWGHITIESARIRFTTLCNRARKLHG